MQYQAILVSKYTGLLILVMKFSNTTRCTGLRLEIMENYYLRSY